MLCRTLVPLCLALAALGGCKTDDDTAASAHDPLGADPSIAATENEAWAGVIRDGEVGEAALFGGVNAEGAAGDVKIYNHLVQFVIQGPYHSHGLIDVGGGVIDADLVRSDGALGRDTIEDVFLGFGLSRLFHASYLDIVDSGGDGGVAEVRTRGTDVQWDYFMGTFEQDRPTLDEFHLDITQIYRLPANSYSLEITTEIRNYGAETEVFTLEDGLFASGEDVRPWAAGGGFEGPDSGTVDAVLFTGRSGEATLSMWPEDQPYTISALSALASELGITLSEHPEVVLEPGETTRFVRHLTVAPDVATAERERWSVHDVPRGEVSGTVLGPGGEAVPGARVHLVDSDGAVANLALTDADGAYVSEVPVGDYTAYVVAHDTPEFVAFAEGAGRYGPYTAASVNEAQLAALRHDATPAPVPYAMGRRTPAGIQVSVSADNTVDASFSLDGRSALHLPEGLETKLRGDQSVDIFPAVGGG